jgi:hypothetical protein
MTEDFIRVYEDRIPTELSNELIKWFDTASTSGRMVRRNGPNIADTQIAVDGARKDFVDNIYACLGPCLEEYADDFPFLKGHDMMSSLCVMQRSVPLSGDGYHRWHSERFGMNTVERVLAWTIYLNDVTEGGETEFLYQGLRVAPKHGRIVIWPAGWTHVHRGNPPLSNTKYILTGWIVGNGDMLEFRLGDGEH